MEIILAVIPPAGVSKEIGALGKSVVKRFPHQFVVDNQKLFPHITLFKIDMEKSDYGKLRKVVKDAVKRESRFNVRVNKFGMPAGGWLDLQVVRSGNLTKLRRRLIQAITAANWGDVSVKQKYRPHITLTRFNSDEVVQTAVKRKPQPSFTFAVNKIGLCLSRQTQVYKIIETIKLKP
jgi:2'-5' RNA ligase